MDNYVKQFTGVETLKHKVVDPLKVDYIHDVQVKQVKDVEIDRIQKIAPLAAHIKEINNIDPITVENFNVTEIKNIDPLRVSEFSVTNLPHVTVSLRQLPAIEMKIRSLPPVAVALSQKFDMPSHYQVGFQVLGFELARISVTGTTHLIPQERFRREQGHTPDASFPRIPVAGNPGIPSHLRQQQGAFAGGVKGNQSSLPSGHVSAHLSAGNPPPAQGKPFTVHKKQKTRTARKGGR
jgi:hypothetical protein